MITAMTAYAGIIIAVAMHFGLGASSKAALPKLKSHQDDRMMNYILSNIVCNNISDTHTMP